MSGAIALFVKTPGLSPVKTRLGKALGDDWARQWHLRSARAVAQVADAAARDLADAGYVDPPTVYWAVAESGAADHHLWQGRRLCIQAGTGLGERMAGVHQTLVERHGWCMLLGADLPQVEPGHLVRAGDWLDDRRPAQVFGPATDGGFWLWGANRVAPAAAWNLPVYSRSDTGARFRAAMAGLGSCLELPAGTDLDVPADLEAVVQALSRLAAPLAGQRDLLQWLTREWPNGAGAQTGAH